jgi:hypothetical protein
LSNVIRKYLFCSRISFNYDPTQYVAGEVYRVA